LWNSLRWFSEIRDPAGTSFMRGDLEAFVDTNVLVYAVSRDEPEKQEKAKAILERGFAEGWSKISLCA